MHAYNRDCVCMHAWVYEYLTHVYAYLCMCTHAYMYFWQYPPLPPKYSSWPRWVWPPNIEKLPTPMLIEINNGQPIPLMWYIFILLFFRILALENIAKILPTGPRLALYVTNQYHSENLAQSLSSSHRDRSTAGLQKTSGGGGGGGYYLFSAARYSKKKYMTDPVFFYH